MVGLGPRLLCSQHPLMSVQETFQCRVIGLFSLLFETFWMWTQTLKSSTRQGIPFPCCVRLEEDLIFFTDKKEVSLVWPAQPQTEATGFWKVLFPRVFLFYIEASMRFPLIWKDTKQAWVCPAMQVHCKFQPFYSVFNFL